MTKPLYPSWMPKGKTLNSSWRNVSQWYWVSEFHKDNPNATLDECLEFQRSKGCF